MKARIGQVILVGLLGLGIYAMPEGGTEARGACQWVVQGCGREHGLCAPSTCSAEAEAEALRAWRATGSCQEGRVVAALEAEACEPTILSSVSSTQ
jgi:hypothetical protein